MLFLVEPLYAMGAAGEAQGGNPVATMLPFVLMFTNLKDDIVLLNIADHVKVEVSRAAVSRVKNGDGKKS